MDLVTEIDLHTAEILKRVKSAMKTRYIGERAEMLQQAKRFAKAAEWHIDNYLAHVAKAEQS